jgi:hypothetical protein
LEAHPAGEEIPLQLSIWSDMGNRRSFQKPAQMSLDQPSVIDRHPVKLRSRIGTGRTTGWGENGAPTVARRPDRIQDGVRRAPASDVDWNQEVVIAGVPACRLQSRAKRGGATHRSRMPDEPQRHEASEASRFGGGPVAAGVIDGHDLVGESAAMAHGVDEGQCSGQSAEIVVQR